LRSLSVWKNQRLVGELSYGLNDYVFRYQKDAGPDAAISLTMPVQAGVYETQVLHPVFQQNLPEGMLADALRKHFGKLIDLSDDIGLLRLTGKYNTSYLQVTEPNETPDSPPWGTLDDVLRHTNSPAIEIFFEYIEKFGVASGISGMQPKLIASLRQTRTKQFQRATISTGSCILKFHDDREYFGLAINEYFCLKAAEYAGLPVAKTYLDDDGEYLIVERFDTKPDGAYFCVEDFCVLQGLTRQGRYNGDYLDLVNTVNRMVPPSQRGDLITQIFQAIAFSLKTGNGDAHLKNFSLMYDQGGNIRLSPAYDLVCTKAYLNKDLPALGLLGEKAWPDENKLLAFANQCGIATKEAEAILTRIEEGKQRAVRDLQKYCKQYTKFRDVYPALSGQWISS